MKKVFTSPFSLFLGMFLFFATQTAFAQNDGLYTCANSTILAESCVGECSNPGELTYTLSGPCPSLIVPVCLSNISSNLCPSHRAIARVKVNGQFVTQGNITQVGSNIAFSAPCGSTIKVVVYAFDVVPGIECVQLGNLKFALSK